MQCPGVVARAFGAWAKRRRVALVVEVVFVQESCLSRQSRASRPTILLAKSYGIGAAVATDNGAFEVGRPSCIGPGSYYEQIGNRTALDGSM
jgi:hypothetical protein